MDIYFYIFLFVLCNKGNRKEDIYKFNHDTFTYFSNISCCDGYLSIFPKKHE